MITFSGIHAEIIADRSPERLVEGSLASGKTTAALWAEFDALRDHPGIWALWTRWTEDAVKSLLRPAIEQIARLRGVSLHWNSQESSYQLENGSRAFAFGLKTVSSDPLQAFSKIRGLPVSRIMFDQAEQGNGGIFSELRFRLRPDLEAKARGITFPTQLTLVANPVPDDHELAREFPPDNHIQGRKHFSLSLFSNSHNLPQTMIDALLQQYPPTHPLYATRIMGQRGLTITGTPIYENIYDRGLHVHDLSQPDDDTSFLEAIEFGKHNPVWVLAQRTYHGALRLLGGVMGKRMMLEDFLPVVLRCRKEWAPHARKFTLCCGSEPGMRVDSTRYSLVRLLREAGFTPTFREDSNSHDTQLAMIELISSALRRRTSGREEALQVNGDESRWLLAFADGTKTERPFMSYAFEGGFVWSPHMVSVANKELRQPLADDEYANAMRCVENLMLNFVAGQRTDEDREMVRRATQSGFTYSEAPFQSPNAWMM